MSAAAAAPLLTLSSGAIRRDSPERLFDGVGMDADGKLQET